MTTSRAAAVAAHSDQKATAIDENHLDRMTLGDRRLEREVLDLFLRQTTLMLDRIMAAEAPVAAAAAHTLKGSARGIGAWRVARAAETLERAAGQNVRDTGIADDRDDLEAAIAELRAASLEAGAAIATRLTVLLAERGGR
ncbi:MAG TPA: Hpt domain-containing protein [Xanthobacteraceae bacterium]|jgi:HPt (histidine-containing phosphotransfer) domain-containing protein|nr:Hpt domain-containing protein [Xanthobacteraceae bacterium]